MVLLDRSKKFATQSLADTLLLDRSSFNKKFRGGSPGQVKKIATQSFADTLLLDSSVKVSSHGHRGPRKKLLSPLGAREPLDFVQVGHMVDATGKSVEDVVPKKLQYLFKYEEQNV